MSLWGRCVAVAGGAAVARPFIAERAIGLDMFCGQPVGSGWQRLRHLAVTNPRLVSVYFERRAIPGTPPQRQAYADISTDPSDGLVRRDLLHVAGPRPGAKTSLPMRLLEVATKLLMATILRVRFHHQAAAGWWLVGATGGEAQARGWFSRGELVSGSLSSRIPAPRGSRTCSPTGSPANVDSCTVIDVGCGDVPCSRAIVRALSGLNRFPEGARCAALQQMVLPASFAPAAVLNQK